MKKTLLLLAFLCFFGGASLCTTIETAAISTPEVQISTVKTGYVLMIIPQFNFPDDEYTIPKVILSRGGYTVEVASQSTREIAIGTDIMKGKADLGH